MELTTIKIFTKSIKIGKREKKIFFFTKKRKTEKDKMSETINIEISNDSEQFNPFYITVQDTVTIPQLRGILKTELKERGIKVIDEQQQREIPVGYTDYKNKDIAKDKSIKELGVESFTLTLNSQNTALSMGNERSSNNKGVKPIKSDKQEKVERTDRYENHGGELGLKTIPNVSCHKCRQKKPFVYVCPINDKHKFCARCLTESDLKLMKNDGCPICRGICQCSLCKKKSA